MRSCLSKRRRHLVKGITLGNLLALSGPFAFLRFLPTRVGSGRSYLRFSFLSPFLLSPWPRPEPLWF